MDPLLMHFLLVAACWAFAFAGCLAIAIGAVLQRRDNAVDRALGQYGSHLADDLVTVLRRRHDSDPQVRP